MIAHHYFLQETAQSELSGYVKGTPDFQFMLIRNAGHSAPMDKPEWVMRMVESFINGTL